MPINAIPATPNAVDKDGRFTDLWRSFFESIKFWLGPIGSSGTTSQRPADASRTPLYIGQSYFDTSLGKPIWVKSRNPTVWVDATGASV